MYLLIDIQGVMNKTMSLINEEKKQALILKEDLKELSRLAYMTGDESRYVYKSCLDKVQILERRIDERLVLLEKIIREFSKVKQQNEEKFSRIIHMLDLICDD